jgi:O-antigen/teichoic acid export membrane protein
VKQKFATNLILLLALNLLVKPFWIFGIDRTVQNLVGAGEYGLFYSLFNFSLLLNIVLDFGLTNFNNREISRHSQLISKYFSNIFIIKILLAIAYGILCLGAGYLMGYNSRQFYLLSLLIFNQFISSFILYLRSNLSGLQYFKMDSVVSVLDRFLMIIICSFLLWGNFANYQFTIEWFVYAQTLSYLITFVITFSLVLPKANFLRFRFDKLFLISILKQSYPFALLALLMTLYSRIDSVMLERMLPKGNIESGIYAQAFRIVDALNMIPFLFAGLLLPMFSRMIKNQEPTQPLVGFAFSLLFIPTFAFAISCIFFRTDLMQLLYHQHTNESASLLGILMVSFLLISINYIFGTLLTANGSIKHLNYISVICVVISLTLNIALIPIYKSLGAAFTNLSTQIVLALFQVYLAMKVFRFKIRVENFMPYLIFIPASILLVVLVKSIFSFWLFGFTVSLMGIVILSFLLRIIRLKELFTLFLKN